MAARAPSGAVRRYLPQLIQLVQNGTISPGKVFDLELTLEQAAAGYRAMDERRAINPLPGTRLLSDFELPFLLTPNVR
jgi:hypothetical protein